MRVKVESRVEASTLKKINEIIQEFLSNFSHETHLSPRIRSGVESDEGEFARRRHGLGDERFAAIMTQKQIAVRSTAVTQSRSRAVINRYAIVRRYAAKTKSNCAKLDM
jgi:hypothetical protein